MKIIMIYATIEIFFSSRLKLNTPQLCFHYSSSYHDEVPHRTGFLNLPVIVITEVLHSSYIIVVSVILVVQEIDLRVNVQVFVFRMDG